MSKPRSFNGPLSEEETRALLLALRANSKEMKSTHMRAIADGNGEMVVADPLEKAHMEDYHANAAQLLQRGTVKLQQVHDAIARLEAGSYGSCVDCEQPIPHARLSALPWADRCRDCQQAVECGVTVVSVSGTRLSTLPATDDIDN